MNKKNKKSKDISLRELEKIDLVDHFIHLSNGNYIGGLTSPKSNEYWKTLPFKKIKQ